MKNLFSITGKLFLTLFSALTFAQDDIPIVIEDFIEQHELLISYRGNDGEIDWESKNEINKKIRFFIEEKYPNVTSTRNIMWDSYHTFIVAVKIKGVSKMKYLNVNYSPNNQKVNSDYIWNDEEKDFVEKVVEEIIDP